MTGCGLTYSFSGEGGLTSCCVHHTGYIITYTQGHPCDLMHGLGLALAHITVMSSYTYTGCHCCTLTLLPTILRKHFFHTRTAVWQDAGVSVTCFDSPMSCVVPVNAFILVVPWGGGGLLLPKLEPRGLQIGRGW